MVFFHRASKVKAIEIREGSEITSHPSVYEEAEGECGYYNVVVQQPGRPHKKKEIRDHIYHPTLGFLPSPRLPSAKDTRDVTLKIFEDDLEIFDIKGVDFSKKELLYKRTLMRKVGRRKPSADDLDLSRDF